MRIKKFIVPATLLCVLGVTSCNSNGTTLTDSEARAEAVVKVINSTKDKLDTFGVNLEASNVNADVVVNTTGDESNKSVSKTSRFTTNDLNAKLGVKIANLMSDGTEEVAEGDTKQHYLTGYGELSDVSGNGTVALPYTSGGETQTLLMDYNAAIGSIKGYFSKNVFDDSNTPSDNLYFDLGDDKLNATIASLKDYATEKSKSYEEGEGPYTDIASTLDKLYSKLYTSSGRYYCLDNDEKHVIRNMGRNTEKIHLNVGEYSLKQFTNILNCFGDVPKLKRLKVEVLSEDDKEFITIDEENSKINCLKATGTDTVTLKISIKDTESTKVTEICDTSVTVDVVVDSAENDFIDVYYSDSDIRVGVPSNVYFTCNSISTKEESHNFKLELDENAKTYLDVVSVSADSGFGICKVTGLDAASSVTENTNCMITVKQVVENETKTLGTITVTIIPVSGQSLKYDTKELSFNKGTSDDGTITVTGPVKQLVDLAENNIVTKEKYEKSKEEIINLTISDSEEINKSGKLIMTISPVSSYKTSTAIYILGEGESGETVIKDTIPINVKSAGTNTSTTRADVTVQSNTIAEKIKEYDAKEDKETIKQFFEDLDASLKELDISSNTVSVTQKGTSGLSANFELNKDALNKIANYINNLESDDESKVYIPTISEGSIKLSLNASEEGYLTDVSLTISDLKFDGAFIFADISSTIESTSIMINKLSGELKFTADYTVTENQVYNLVNPTTYNNWYDISELTSL